MRRDWKTLGPPFAAVLIGTALGHFLVGLARAPGAPASPRRMPDSRLLAEVVLPIATPFELHEPDLASRIRPEYYGHLALDTDGLRLKFGVGSMVHLHPDMDRVALESVTLALAEPAPSGFRLVREGPRSELSPPNAPFVAGGGVLSTMSYAEIFIPGVTVYDLVGRWPVVIHRIRLSDPKDYEEERMEIVSHGSIRAFEPLTTPRPWQNP